MLRISYPTVQKWKFVSKFKFHTRYSAFIYCKYEPTLSKLTVLKRPI